jgi:hypothetical protein
LRWSSLQPSLHLRQASRGLLHPARLRARCWKQNLLTWKVLMALYYFSQTRSAFPFGNQSQLPYLPIIPVHCNHANGKTAQQIAF